MSQQNRNRNFVLKSLILFTVDGSSVRFSLQLLSVLFILKLPGALAL